jgi:nitroreductase
MRNVDGRETRALTSMTEVSPSIHDAAHLAAVASVLRGRRTVHDFSAEVPPREQLMDAIESARWAPNHHRTEPWCFYVLGRDVAERITELNAELVRAKNGEAAAEAKRRRWSAMPGWFALTCLRSEDPMREREDYAACCCAVQNLMLHLWVLGIGVKWGTGKVTRDPRFLAMLGIDAAREFVVGLFWYGYPAAVPAQARRPASEIVRAIEHVAPSA